MSTSPAPAGAVLKLGNIDRWIIMYLSMGGVIYALSDTVAYEYVREYGPRVTTGIMVLVAMFKAFQVKPAAPDRNGYAVLLMGALLMVAVVNMAISWDIIETSLRWSLWFGMVFTITRITRSADGSWVEAAMQRLPYLFLITYLAVILTASRQSEETAIRSAYHLSGLYGNLILATGLFARKSWQRAIWFTIGLVAIYFSGAGGALFTIPIMFIPFILYSTTSMPVKGLTLAIVFMLGATIFLNSDLFTRFLDIKLNIVQSDDTSYTGVDRLERSKDERIALIDYGLGLLRENPLGTGLGHTYQDVIMEEMHVAHVHNGTVSLMVELGYIGFMITAASLLWVFYCILRNKMISNRIKGFYFTYFFTIFGRSLSENYTPFDLGNFFTLVFLLFTGYLYLFPRTAAIQNASGLPGRRPMMMMPPPPRGARQPWARPVQVR